FKFDCLFHGQIARLCALQKFVHESGGVAIHCRKTCPIVHQATGLDCFLPYERAGQELLRSEADDPFSVLKGQLILYEEKTFRTVFGDYSESGVKILSVSYGVGLKRYTKGMSRGLCASIRGHVCCISRVPKHRHSGEAGDHLLEELNSFC